MSGEDQLSCPYCDAALSATAVSCKSCGRDLVPVLPLLRRLTALEAKVLAFETAAARPIALPAPAASTEAFESAPPEPPGPRLYFALPVGFLALMAAYWMVVIWLDLPLAYLRLASILIPFVTGVVYFGVRPRLAWADAAVAIVFAVSAVAAMNALLGWIDEAPMAPQDVAAWRETFFYTLSISASMFSGMLLRVTQTALKARGLTSIPRLRDGLLGANGKLPMDTLKAIELTILLVSTVVSAITGLLAGLLGVLR